LMVRLIDYRVLEEEGRLEEIVYTLEDDKWGVYYRVVKLLRLLRSPRELSQVETLLEMHRDVVASFKQFTKARLVLLAAYSKKHGLIWAYGVAVWSYDLDKAREWAERLFLALKSVLRGTYRQAVFRELTVDEASEILRIMSESDSAAALVGLPEPRDSYSRSPSKGYFIGTRMVEMVEEIVRGLVAEQREFVYSVVAQPMPPRQLLALLNRVNGLLTKYSTFEETASLGFYVSLPLGYTQSRVYTSGASTGRSRTHSRQHSHSLSSADTQSQGVAVSETHGRAETTGYAEHESHTVGSAHTVGHSHTVGRSETESVAQTEGVSSTRGSSRGGFTSTTTTSGFATGSTYVPAVTSTSRTSGTTTPATIRTVGTTQTSSEATTTGTTTTSGTGVTKTSTISGGLEASGKPFGVGVSFSAGGSTANSSSAYTSTAQTQSSTVTKGSSTTQNLSVPVTPSVSSSQTTSTTQPYVTTSRTYTATRSAARGASWSTFSSTTRSASTTRSHSSTVSEAWTDSESWTTSEAFTRGTTRSQSSTVSESHGVARSTVSGEARGEGFAEASVSAEASTAARSYSVSEGGIWGMGAIPGISMSYATKRLDEAKRTVYELLSLEKQRFLEALSSGGFFVQAVILGSRETIEAAKALVLSSFTPTRPNPEPLFVLDGDGELLLAAKTLSFDYRRDGRHPIRVYKVVNVYTATELAGLTHPPRVQVKGVEVVAENVPEFSLPSGDSWDIELGWAISHETLQPEVRWGYRLDELGHVGVFGASGSGKTVAATNLAYQASRRGFKVVAIDWKYEWRRLLRVVEGRKAFFALYERPGLPVLKWNPLRPPRGVHWREWMRVVLEWFVITYGLGSRSIAVMRRHLWRLYTEASGTGGYPSLRDLYESIREERERAAKGKVSFDKLDIYDKIMDRLWPYAEGDLRELFGEDSETDIVDLVLGHDFVDFEAGGMADTDKPFLLSLIVFALYYHAKYTGRYRQPVLVVVEEAHQVAFNLREKYSAEAVNLTEDVWGKLAAEGRAYNLYGLFIVQYPSRLNPMVLANLMSVIAFRLNLETYRDRDVSTIVRQLGKDPERFGNEYARFLERLPIGYALTIKKRVKEFFKAEPVLVKFDLFEPPEATEKEILSATTRRLTH